jgi:hypothetical protein
MDARYNRLFLFALITSLLFLSISIEGCVNNGATWFPRRDANIGITAKQGYAKALDKINATYNGSINETYLIRIRSTAGDVTKSGKATYWMFDFCLKEITNQYRNMTVYIYNNGTKTIYDRNQTSLYAPQYFIQNWTVDSNRAMQLTLNKKDVSDFIKKRSTVDVDRMDLSNYYEMIRWTIRLHGEDTLDSPIYITTVINGSE